MFTLITDIDHIHGSGENALFTDYWSALRLRFPPPDLVYKTDASLIEALDRITDLRLPMPAYIIAERGQTIYSCREQQSLPKWTTFIHNDTLCQKNPQEKDYTDFALNWLKYSYLHPYPSIVVGFTPDDLLLFKSACDYGVVTADAADSLKEIINNQRTHLSSKRGVEGLIEGVDHFISVIETNSYVVA